ncbi:hypothetical protein FQZ97_1147220 [compost metagenome]
MVDLALQALGVLCRHAQSARLEVAIHRHGARRAHAPVAAQLGHLVFALRAQQEVHHRAFARQKLLDQAAPDETRCTRDEILHETLPLRRPPFCRGPGPVRSAKTRPFLERTV